MIYCSREEMQALRSRHFLWFMCESLQKTQKLERKAQMRIKEITPRQYGLII